MLHWYVRKGKKGQYDEINELEKIWHAVLVHVCFPLHSVFSATWPDGVRRLAKSYLKNPMMVYVGTLDLAVSCPFLFFPLPFVEEPTLETGKFLLVTNCICVDAHIFCNQSELSRNSSMLFILKFP